jgi:glutathione synthase/RimK-type ligase-like ATP-grasp enzyme
MNSTLLVVDDLKVWSPYQASDAVVAFSDYLSMSETALGRIRRVINLCDTEKYLSHGYYCSLLAEARGHRVLPTVNAINDLRRRELYLMHFDDLKDALPKPLGTTRGECLKVKCYFGHCQDKSLAPLARRIFERLGFPILEMNLQYKGEWGLRSLRAIPIEDLDDSAQSAFAEALEQFSHRVWRSSPKLKKARWEMAIYVNPKEALPPSDEQALRKMVKAAAKLGVDAEIVTARESSRIGEYDALFIRETTEINHPTYRLARRAELEGLVVIDDPVSILRCCNKLFLLDAFRRGKVPTLPSLMVQNRDRQVVEKIEASFAYPVILKIPNGSFSRGVVKVENRTELKTRLRELFQQSTLLLAQEYLYTPFDWRIGVINNKPLYANRYHMAKDHWQIYEHGADGTRTGGFDALPTFEVPRPVLQAAMKAAAAVGEGFYGIDLKQSGNAAYVIEVNDNPSIEQGVEDAFLGDELYMQIMGEFVRRLENRGRLLHNNL